MKKYLVVKVKGVPISMNQKVYEMELAGRKLSIETGRLAMQARCV